MKIKREKIEIKEDLVTDEIWREDKILKIY